MTGTLVVRWRGEEASEFLQAMPFILTSVTFLTCATMWTTGLVGFLILVLPLLTCYLWTFARVWSQGEFMHG